jgi:hypothetical protein
MTSRLQDFKTMNRGILNPLNVLISRNGACGWI